MLNEYLPFIKYEYKSITIISSVQLYYECIYYHTKQSISMNIANLKSAKPFNIDTNVKNPINKYC